VQKAKGVTKQIERAALYQKAEVIVKEEAPWITVAHSMRFDPVRKEVIGYKMDATAHHYFNKVDMVEKCVELTPSSRDFFKALAGRGLSCSPSSSNASPSYCPLFWASPCSCSR
jgi:hypothetical protein